MFPKYAIATVGLAPTRRNRFGVLIANPSQPDCVRGPPAHCYSWMAPIGASDASRPTQFFKTQRHRVHRGTERLYESYLRCLCVSKIPNRDGWACPDSSQQRCTNPRTKQCRNYRSSPWRSIRLQKSIRLGFEHVHLQIPPGRDLRAGTKTQAQYPRQTPEVPS